MAEERKTVDAMLMSRKNRNPQKRMVQLLKKVRTPQ